jgi:hypothetical protein
VTGEFDFDDEAKSVTFKGHRLHLLLGLIQRAKFGDRHDKELLLNGWLADLSWRIARALDLGAPQPPSTPMAVEPTIFDTDLVLAIRDAIIADGVSMGWWSWSIEERRRYLREVVAAPTAISESDIEQIEDAIETWLWRARQVVEAAAADADSAS